MPGLYGYSWDMMVHAWDTILVVVKVHDNDNDIDYYVNPEIWNENDRWYKHGDMIKQYAHCLEVQQKLIFVPIILTNFCLTNIFFYAFSQICKRRWKH